MEGTFEGVKTHPEIKEPHFRAEGWYSTVRYGTLAYFALYVPKGSKVKEINEGAGDFCYTYYLVITPDGKEYAFKVFHGNAYDPGVGREIDVEVFKKKERERRIIEEAEKVNPEPV